MQEYSKFELFYSLKEHINRLIPTCILASSSPKRKELLENLGVKVFQVGVNAEEYKDPFGNPQKVANANTRLKQDRFFELYNPNEVVYPIFTADTVIGVPLSNVSGIIPEGTAIVDDAAYVLGKPKTKENAFKMLSFLRKAKVHKVYTSLFLTFYDPFFHHHATSVASDSATLVFKDGVSDDDIRNYIETTDGVLDAAGAYKIQDNPDRLFSQLYGDITTVEGFSYTALSKVLMDMDVILRE